jgi:hypothetical protein
MASLPISAGTNVKAVQRPLGQATATMTLDRCGHPAHDDRAGVADVLNNVDGSTAGWPRCPASYSSAEATENTI